MFRTRMFRKRGGGFAGLHRRRLVVSDRMIIVEQLAAREQDLTALAPEDANAAEVACLVHCAALKQQGRVVACIEPVRGTAAGHRHRTCVAALRRAQGRVCGRPMCRKWGACADLLGPIGHANPPSPESRHETFAEHSVSTATPPADRTWHASTRHGPPCICRPRTACEQRPGHR
jgi:hypothetical protein